MSSMWGNKLKISVFGESHGPAIGITLEGLPAGQTLDFDYIKRQMARRAPKKTAASTTRNEADEFEIISGVLNGKITGAPLTALIRNTDTRSGDYADMTGIPRPGHADYTAAIRYNNANDPRGGGHFSGRLAAVLVFAGAVCMQILSNDGIYIGAHIQSIGAVIDTPFDPVGVDEKIFSALAQKEFPVNSGEAGEKMLAEIDGIRKKDDSIGGVIECAVIGMKPGLGGPMFDGVENRIASIVFGIPAVKGIEFGAGFAAAKMRGSENNDCFYMYGKSGALAKIKTETNHSGGILGGITTGMPVIFRAAIKPTPSIATPQTTLNIKTGQQEELIIRGRHDACIVPRAVPVVESAAAVSVLDMIL